MDKALIIAVLAVTLTGCSTFREPPPPPPNPVGLPCSVGPIRPDEGVGERWTDDELDQLNLINETGEISCGWKP